MFKCQGFQRAATVHISMSTETIRCIDIVFIPLEEPASRQYTIQSNLNFQFPNISNVLRANFCPIIATETDRRKIFVFSRGQHYEDIIIWHANLGGD